MTGIDILTFDSGKPGPSLLVFGAIHGNEVCGTHAIGRAAVELRSGIFSIDRGKLTMVPICNTEAYKQNKRYIDANLNRVFCKHDNPVQWEQKAANVLCPLVDKTDYFLDLHSYSSGVRPFLFLDPDTPDYRKLASAFGIPWWVTGWNDLYAAQGLSDNDTCSYALRQGKEAILIECGLHGDPAAAVVAYKSLRAALKHYGMAEAYEAPDATPPQVNRLTSVLVKEREGKLLKNWQHLDPVSKGEAVLQYDDGEIYASPVDGVILLPGKNVTIGDEWVYFGVAA